MVKTQKRKHTQKRKLSRKGSRKNKSQRGRGYNNNFGDNNYAQKPFDNSQFDENMANFKIPDVFPSGSQKYNNDDMPMWKKVTPERFFSYYLADANRTLEEYKDKLDKKLNWKGDKRYSGVNEMSESDITKTIATMESRIKKINEKKKELGIN